MKDASRSSSRRFEGVLPSCFCRETQKKTEGVTVSGYGVATCAPLFATCAA